MDLKKIRQYLHQHPELSGEEHQTAAFIVRQLKELGLTKIHTDFAPPSLLAEMDFGKPGKTVLFRCELDALPIEETNVDLSFVSKQKGISHKCGHDGHMAILLGLAKRIVEEPPKAGKVLLLFQSAEETGQGARAVLDSQKLKEFDIDKVFALHNIPGYPLGSVICKPGSFTPSVESVDILLEGKTSHAGMPEKGINPAQAVSEIISYFGEIHQPVIEQKDYFLTAPIQIQMGTEAYGTSAGKAVVSYTVRSYDFDFFERRKKQIEKEVQKIVKKTPGLQLRLEWKEAFAANTNDVNAYQRIKQAAEENELPYIEKENGFTWGEDFGLFTQHYPGAMFGLGSGENQPELHNPDYDFPDALIETGIQMFERILKSTLL